MSNESPPAVGIDLGTTYSAIARLDVDGRPLTLVNAEGDLLTPSVVLWDGAEVVVGKEALKAIGSEPAHVADCVKRDMGERFFRKPVDGRELPPEVLSAWILHKLRQDASRELGEFRHAVITVPAYFDDARRKATQDAGYMAGLEVLDIINEPTAAALAYGFQQGFLDARGTSQRPQTIVVYDLGGGTFDVTIMQIAGAEFRTLATDGDVRLGGRDWDQRLIDHAASEFARQHGEDPRDDPAALGRLWRECEDTKRTLSARAKATLAFDFHGRPLRLEITREQFESLTRDLLERTSFTTRQALRDAGCDWSRVDRVLVVGGASRMPMVRDMLRQLASTEPQHAVAADEAVAHGAALHAGLILSAAAGRPAPFRVRNVNSHNLGVIATNRHTGERRNAVVIPRNTPLPVAARRLFRTEKAEQNTVLVQIVEGESASPEGCTLLGQCVVRDLPSGLPAKTPIEVCFSYAANGRLSIAVRVARSDRNLTYDLSRPVGLDPRERDAWRSTICAER